MIQISIRNCLRLAVVTGGILTALPVLAHTGNHVSASGFSAGFSHPFSGLDHLLAMFAVGLWAAQNKRPALWLLPILFPMMMALGAVFGITHGVFGGIETSIAGTVAVLGLFIAFSLRMPIQISAAVIALFASLHGYAHGAELPQGASAIAYMTGFITATALLYIVGVSVGLIAQGKIAVSAIRLSGIAITSAGIYFIAIA